MPNDPNADDRMAAAIASLHIDPETGVIKADPSRECGPCTACCTYLGIAELQKPANVPCKHLTKVRSERCCSIYTKRPRSCQTYACTWLQGAFAKHMRPDRAGLMVSIYRSEISGETYSATMVIIDARRAGSLREGAVHDFVEYLINMGLNDIRIIDYKTMNLIWLCKGLIRQGKLLNQEGFEDLKFEAYDPPIGAYEARDPQET